MGFQVLTIRKNKWKQQKINPQFLDEGKVYSLCRPRIGVRLAQWLILIALGPGFF